MITRTFAAIVLTLFVSGSAHAADPARFVPASEIEPVVGRYVVTFVDGLAADDETTAQALARTYGARLETFAANGLRGALMTMRPAQARSMSADARVTRVAEEPRSETEVPLWESGTYAYDRAGNVKGIGSDEYRYDGVGRLVYATAITPAHEGNAQEFTYDRYGNLTRRTTHASGSTPLAEGFPVNAASNQLKPPAPCDSDICYSGVYDEAGNQRGTGVSQIDDFTFDALGVMTRLHSIHDQAYVYDANDERILTIQFSGDAELFHRYALRGPDNKIARELTLDVSTETWSLAKDYVYRGGALIASFSSPTATTPDRHYHLDHLGSTRLVTDASGFEVARLTYWPFGAEAPGSVSAPFERLKFTGHERDSDGSASVFNLDYMHARYYGGTTGRFLSVDRVLGEPSRPQTWNRYTYVNNNPLNLIDPKGMYETNCGEDLDCQLNAAIFEGARADALASRNADARAAAAAYGEPGDANGVLVTFGATSKGTPAETAAATVWSLQMVVGPPGVTGHHVGSGAPTPLWGLTVTFKDVNAITPANVAHEGVHVSHALPFFRSWDGSSFNDSLRVTDYYTESAAYHVTAAFTPRNGMSVGNHVFRPGMNAQQKQAVIDAILSDSLLGYNVTPTQQGGSWPP